MSSLGYDFPFKGVRDDGEFWAVSGSFAAFRRLYP